MDGDLGAKLEAILSNPEQMDKITQMAKGLMGQAEAEAPKQDGGGQPEGTPLSSGDARILAALGKAFAGGKEGSGRSAALLGAMRPYMRPEKQEKLDRAMKIARLARIAGAVMKEYGGEGNGL